MQSMMDKLSKLSEKGGLRISKEKTKVRKIGDIVDDRNIILDNQDLETIQNFKYLGGIQSCSGDTEVHVNCRIGKACGVFRKLGTVWSSRNISLPLKMRIYTSSVLSTALYACDTWKNTTHIANSVDVSQMNCLREIMKVKRLDRIRHDDILRRTHSRTLSSVVTERRLSFTGHLLRLPENRPAKVALNWTPWKGERQRGRPKKTWRHLLWKICARDEQTGMCQGLPKIVRLEDPGNQVNMPLIQFHYKIDWKISCFVISCDIPFANL